MSDLPSQLQFITWHVLIHMASAHHPHVLSQVAASKSPISPLGRRVQYPLLEEESVHLSLVHVSFLAPL